MERVLKSTFLASIIILSAGVAVVHAQWVAGGQSVCSATGSQDVLEIADDGAGGAIIVWQDARGADQDIYAQRIDASGIVRWTTDGVAVCTATDYQSFPRITADGSGGAIIVWQDRRGADYDIYAQRIDASGSLLWTTDGVAICAVADNQDDQEIIADGSGGAIIVWQDNWGADSDIYAQRIDASGSVQWTIDGVSICTAIGWQFVPSLITDGVGGAIILWTDFRGSDEDIYIQRIDAWGTVRWTTNGVPVCTEANSQHSPALIADGFGGAICAWTDDRTTPFEYNIYAQRINSSGNTLWATDGLSVCLAPGLQFGASLASDGEGGAFIEWTDTRNGAGDIFAQRIGALGAKHWAATGVGVATESNWEEGGSITTDGTGGAIIAYLLDTGITDQVDVYAQRIDADGNILWTPSGVGVCTEQNIQRDKRVVLAPHGSAIIAWYDERTPGNSNIYAQRIEATHGYRYPAPTIADVIDVPDDQGGKISVVWNASWLDTFPATFITHYSLWRKLPFSAHASFIADDYASEKLAQGRFELSGSTYRIVALNGMDTAWEWLAEIPAHYVDTYAYTVESLADSINADPNWQVFMVSAQTSDPFAFYDSPLDSGYSVDNLLPAAPTNVAGEQTVTPPGLRLTWDASTDEDLSSYKVYRESSPEFTSQQGNLIATTTDPTYFDDQWRWYSDYVYKITAVDVHGNEGAYALFESENVIDTGDSQAPRLTYLGQNVPNPFYPSTKIYYGLRETSDVSLRIFDVAGRLVRVLVNGRREARQYQALWDGRDAHGREVASGVYFYRLTAGSFTETRKMVLTK